MLGNRGWYMNKQQKFEQREMKIITSTMDLLKNQGFVELKMAQVASASKCSMGAVYSHFTCKEELLLSCSITLNYKQLSMIKQSERYMLSDIKQLILFAMIFWEQNIKHPELYEIMTLSNLPSMWRKVSAEKLSKLKSCDSLMEEALRLPIVRMLNIDISDQNSAMSFMGGYFAMIVGLLSFHSSGYEFNASNEDFNFLKDNLTRYFLGWSIDIQCDIDEWNKLSLIAKDIVIDVDDKELN